MYGFNLFIFPVNTAKQNYIAKKVYLILIKAIFLQINIQEMRFELIEDPANDINTICYIHIGQDVIQINNHKHFWFFCQYLINISLEVDQFFGKTQQNHLIPKTNVSGAKSCFLLISFANTPLVINIDQIKPSKSFGAP